MTTCEPGSEIAGYRIESLVGRGGMAVVYRAEDMRLGRKVALKLLAPQLADSEQFRKRFMRESRLAASLDHPNIVPIYEAGEADGQLFIAMRYVLGRDLAALLAEQGGQLSVARLLPLLGQVGDALDSAHRNGLVHRDVKPGNILVVAGQRRPGQAHRDHVYLTDFGLTKRTSELAGGLTGAGQFLGTVDYVSPEQIQGKPVGPGTDIYALGCVLYECLAGRLPFCRDDEAALLWAHLVDVPPPVTGVRPELPGAVDAVVTRAMAKEPADRYETCAELLHALEVALDLPAPVSSGVGPTAEDGREAPRRSGAMPDSTWGEGATVIGEAVGGAEHPSFPSDPSPQFPTPADSSYRSARPADPEVGLGEDARPGERGGSDRYADAGADRDERKPVALPAHGPRTRRWRSVALVAAAAVIVAVAAVLLRSSWLPEDYRTYTSSQTVVPFRLDHPADWGSAVGPASDIVLAPDPTLADDLFFLKGTPEAWASATNAVRSSSPGNVWLYVYAPGTTFDTSGDRALQDSVALLLPDTTRFDPAPPRRLTVAGSSVTEMAAVTSDPAHPQTRLRVLVDAVEAPEGQGSVLLAFFTAPDTFDDQRPTFGKIRDSLQIFR
jgi:serine/threonine protein kinase